MASQPSGNVRENDVTVFEFDGKGRARKNLFDASERFERGFLNVLGSVAFRRPRRGLSSSISNGYKTFSFLFLNDDRSDGESNLDDVQV